MGLFDKLFGKKSQADMPAPDATEEDELLASVEYQGKQIEFSVLAHSPGEFPNGETHDITFDEMLEDDVGSDFFNSLEAKFAAISGVESAFHEDREVFRLNAPGLTNEQIASAVKLIFQ